MLDIIVFGNGLSRKNLKLDLLVENYILVGCNGFYRDFSPDYLVAIDPPMIKEIRDSNYQGNLVTPKRDPPLNKRVLYMEGKSTGCLDPHWNAGPTAAFWAAHYLTGSTIHLVGFDFRGGNIYNDTDNYRAATDPVPNYNPDLTHFKKIFTKYTGKDWIYYNDRDRPSEWHSITNVIIKPLSELSSLEKAAL